MSEPGWFLVERRPELGGKTRLVFSGPGLRQRSVIVTEAIALDPLEVERIRRSLSEPPTSIRAYREQRRRPGG